jgi:hypothetical protein
MIQANRFDIALTATCCILAGIFAYEVLAPLGEFTLPAVSVPDRPPLPTVAPFNPPPQSAFAAIDARPIFNPTRKPVESTAVAGGTTATAPPDVALVGVIIDSKTQMALVKREGAPFSESVLLGASLDGWEVTEITADHVTLRSGGQELNLRMDARRRIQASQPGQPSNATAQPATQPGMTMPSRGRPARPQSGTTQAPPSDDGSDGNPQHTGTAGAQ